MCIPSRNASDSCPHYCGELQEGNWTSSHCSLSQRSGSQPRIADLLRCSATAITNLGLRFSASRPISGAHGIKEHEGDWERDYECTSSVHGFPLQLFEIV